MIVKKEIVIDQRRFRTFVRLSVFFEKGRNDVPMFTSECILHGMLVAHSYMVKNPILPVCLKLDQDARPAKIQIEENKEGMIITIDRLTAELLVKQTRVTHKYGNGNKIVLIKNTQNPLEENDLSILRLLVENRNKK